MAVVGGVGGAGGSPLGPISNTADSGAASVGSLGTVASINAQSATRFQQTLGAASNADLTKIASTAGVDGDKRAQALTTLIDRLSGSGQAGTNASETPEDSNNDDDFTKKLRKLMKDMKAGKMDAEDQKTLAAIGSMNQANDTTAGGISAADIR